MENSPLHVCRLQPARSELMSALLDAGGAFGARKAGALAGAFALFSRLKSSISAA
jgi:hypothetical protein